MDLYLFIISKQNLFSRDLWAFIGLYGSSAQSPFMILVILCPKIPYTLHFPVFCSIITKK